MTLVRKRLHQLGRVVTGKTPPTARQELFKGEYLFVTPSDLDYNHYYCRSAERTVSEQAKATLRNQFIPANAVMFTCIGATIGKCGIAPAECLTNQQINSVIANDECDPKFLYYLLCNSVDIVKGMGGGAATPIVNKSKFENIDFLVPPLRQQQEIGRILSAYDDMIENNRRRIALMEEAARLLYREWFIHFRFPGHEHVPLTDGLPEGWERRTVGSVLTLQRGFDLPVAKRLSGDVPVYGSTGIVGQHNIPKVSFPTVITGRSGSLGHVCFVDDPCWPLNTALWVKEFKAVSAYFAFFLLESMNLKQFNGGASVPTLDRNVVHAAHVTLPPALLVSLFDEQAATLFAQKKTLEQQNQKLAQARDLLLPRLMNREIAV